MTVAAIIAGGLARRMGGAPKGLLVVGQQRIIDRQLQVLGPLFSDVVMVANDPTPWAGLSIRVIADRVPGLGPIAGLDAVLASLPPGVDDVVCVGGDMPFLTTPALELVRDLAPGARAVAPRVSGRAEPLLARYHRDTASVVAEQIAAGRYGMSALLERLAPVWIEEQQLRGVDPALTCLTNVNTPEELATL